MLAILHKAYDYPVDVEFTANFFPDSSYKINLVQCRPLQVKGGGPVTAPAPHIEKEDLVVEAHGAVIGESRLIDVDRMIYVEPALYGQLPVAERYAVARLIGRLAHADSMAGKTIMMLGPGRWGTTTPSLGIPARFADINTVSVLVEIVAMRDDLVPDVSLGTHFLNELIEMDILYLALFPTRQDNFLNKEFFASAPNRLAEVAPDAAAWAPMVRIIDTPDLGGAALKLHANTLKQTVLCYLERKDV
jgi:pyruvate,water dikinase